MSASEKEDIRERRASLHPFEYLAFRAAEGAKKLALKVQKKMVEKLG